MNIVNAESLLDYYVMQHNEIKTCDYYIQSRKTDEHFSEGDKYHYYGIYKERHYVSTKDGSCVGLSSEDFERVFSAKMTAKEVKKQLTSLADEARSRIETYDVEDVFAEDVRALQAAIKAIEIVEAKRIAGVFKEEDL